MSDELELGGGEGGGQTVLSRLLEDEMRESFIDYSMSVIVQRALPDVRDGLKPVHRRILYAMSQAGLSPGRAYKKSATVVGDVLGKYHPHGDSAVYDSMVRMVQDFSLRYPLVDGQGNFGSVDGDSAAAYRYTEARLMPLATELLADIEKETVNYADNFDGSHQEPTVLPARVPNLLINGSSGIAVGMATNIPPHNLREVVAATTALIDNPDLSQDELETLVTGPDFPTGGFICGRDGIRDAYRTGRGRIVMRARATIEPIDANSERIVITEIPFMVNKSRLIEQIAQLVRDKKLPDIRDLRDESDREGMRIVVELKRDAVPEIVLNRLYRHTQMQSTFGTILLALVDGVPKVMSLRETLQHFIDHRLEVIVRRSEYDLERALEREHILEGLKIAVDNIDEVIKIIRGSKDTLTASSQLQEAFDLSERQAKAILDMRLARLTGLEIEKLEEELTEVRALIAELRRILDSEVVRMGILKEELAEVSDKYGDERRSEITHAIGSFNVEDLIVEQDMVVTVSHGGYVKRLPVDTYRAQRRGGRGLRGMDTKEEDFVEHLFVASTHDYLMIFTRRGRCYWKKVWEIPEGSRASRGKPIVNLLNLGSDEKIAAVVPVREFSEDHYLMFGTRRGIVKKTALSAYGNVRSVGLNAINIADGDELIEVRVTSGGDEILLASRKGMAIRFNESDARPMGRATGGVRGLNLRDDDEVVGMVVAREDSTVLVVSEKGLGKRTPISEYRLQKRGGFGVINLKVSEKTGEVVTVRAVSENEQLMIITRKGVVNRQRVEEIRVIGRATQGVRLVSLDDGDVVMDVARVIIDEESGDELEGTEAPVGDDVAATSPEASNTEASTVADATDADSSSPGDDES
ncbi:MAG: DNA gyrase subunit A [Gemmatimonadota bacterium]|nr:DNA gyrase subunit A [Gemmatimonadota bacterium]MDE3014008.1 DNA gyrase subunit A [Gemmatimonadota bacterium]